MTPDCPAGITACEQHYHAGATVTIRTYGFQVRVRPLGGRWRGQEATFIITIRENTVVKTFFTKR
jgi:hypothetical protein